MTCDQLAAKLQQLQPSATANEIARLTLLLTQRFADLDEFEDDEVLDKEWQQLTIRLQAATDQHAAMTADLEELAAKTLDDFTLNEVWVLIRAIRVQQQILQMYIGQPVDV